MHFPSILGYGKHHRKFQHNGRASRQHPWKYIGNSKKYKGNYTISCFQFFSSKIEYLDNFRSPGLIVEVLTEPLTPILTYVHFYIYVIFLATICHIWHICHLWQITYDICNTWNMSIWVSKVPLGPLELNPKYSILNRKKKKCVTV